MPTPLNYVRSIYYEGANYAILHQLPSVGLPGCSFPNLSNSSGVGSVSLANLAATNPLGPATYRQLQS